MPVPRVAIVGRPNVGKSSLLNMLAARKVSIVDPTPGVTRDRVSALVELTSEDALSTRLVEFTDTGGYGVYVAEDGRYDEVGNDLASLTDDVEFQIAEAVENADMVLLCIDCQAGITPQDQEIARLLREQRLGQRRTPGRRVPVHVLATKCDGPKWETHALEIAALGFGEPLMCSAANNYLRRSLVEQLHDIVPHVDDERAEPEADLKIAIIGKRNAGKSTLVNALAGRPRVIVSEIPGTTRDAVDVRIERDGRSILAIDTAGLRRKKSFQGAIEHYAYDRLKQAVSRCDVVLLLVDAAEPTSQVDEQLAWMVQRSFKPVVLVLNKWDIAEGRKNAKGQSVGPEAFEEYLRKEFKGLPFAPIAIIAARDGTNIEETIELAFDLKRQAQSRIGTGELNRLVRDIVERQGPSSGSGVHTKVFYAAQIRSEPPTIVLVVNHPDLFKPNYMRFLENRLREIVPFGEIPFRIVVRAKRRDEDGLREPDRGREAEGTPARDTGTIDAEAVRAAIVSGAASDPDAGAPDAFALEGVSREELEEILADLPDDADAYFEDGAGDDDEK
ncbi:MAG: ribosome biogenesis GTPase Der [Phycisphaeraceae bacterium]|nr:ribosome biogenesis GTPase Der [Phycisphaeraceae bacterium]